MNLSLNEIDQSGIKQFAISESDQFPQSTKTTSANGFSLSPEHQLSGIEGTYYLHVKIWDNAGNSSVFSGKDGKGLKIIFDKSKPVFSNVVVSDGTSSGSEISSKDGSLVRITGKISDSNSGVGSVFIKGEEITVAGDGTFKSGKLALTEGKNDFKITSKDRAGNSADSVIVTVNYDSKEPTLSLAEESKWRNGRYFNDDKIEAYLTVTEDSTLKTNPAPGSSSVLTQISSTTITQGSNKIEFTFSGEGAHDLEIWAEDKAGNTSAPTKEKRNKLKVFIDKKDPNISFDSTPKNLTKDSYVDFVLNVSEPSGFYSSGIDSNTVKVNDVFPCQLNIKGKYECKSIALTKGVNNLTFSAKDKAGNSNSIKFSITLDNDTPIFSVAAGENGKWVQSSSTTIVANLLEESNINIKVGEPSGSTCPASAQNPKIDCYPKTGSTCQNSPASSLNIPVSNLKSGLNCVYFEVTDTAGNKISSIVQVLRDDKAPSISLKELLVASNVITPSQTTTAWEFKNSSNKALFKDEPFITNSSTNQVTLKGNFSDDDKNTNQLNDSGIKQLLLNGIDILIDQSLSKGLVSGSFSYLYTLQPGLNRIEMAIIDRSGRKTKLRNLDIYFDNSAPRTIVSNDKITQYSTSLAGHIYFSSSESGEVEIIKTNPTGSAVSLSASPVNINKAYVTQAISVIDASDKADGTYSFKLIPKDRAYPSPNQPSTTDLQTVQLIVDTLKPTIKLRSPSQLSSKDSNTKSILVEIEANDATSGISLVTIAGAKSDFNGSIYSRTVGISEGQNKIVVEAIDKAGNSKVYSFIFSKDTEKPVLSLDTITEYPSYGGKYYVKNANSVTPSTTLSLSGTVNEAVTLHMTLTAGNTPTKLSETIDSGGSFSSSKVVLNTEGENNLSLYSEDSLGNKSNTQKLSFIYDKTKPVVSLTEQNGSTNLNPTLVAIFSGCNRKLWHRKSFCKRDLLQSSQRSTLRLSRQSDPL